MPEQIKDKKEGKAVEFLEDIVSKVETGKISEEILNIAIDKLERYQSDIELTLQHPDEKIPDKLADRSKKAKNVLDEIEDKLIKILESESYY